MNNLTMLMVSVVLFMVALAGINYGFFTILSWLLILASGIGILHFSNSVFSGRKDEEVEEVVEEDNLEEKKEEEVE